MPAEPSLTAAERMVLSLARREGWPHALLTPELKPLGGKAARARWMHVSKQLKRVGRERMLALCWPKGTTGAVIRLAGGGWLLLGLFKKGGKGPSPAHLKLLGELVREHARTAEALALKTRTLQAVLHLGHALSSIKDLKQLVASQMVPELVQLLHADRGSVFLIDQDKQELYSVVALGA
ncbi:MAG: hypothetical protein AAB368_17735, partial [bacterium]